MNPFFTKLIIQTTLKKKNGEDQSNYSKDELAKGESVFWIMLKRAIKDFFLITIGILSACFGFKGFLLTNHFIDGGATGIALLLAHVTSFQLSWLILLVNLPFVFFAYKTMGKWFTIKTTLAITGLALALALLEVPDVTKDNLLVAVFGGFFLGAGIGFTIRGGAVIDGTEVLAIFLSRKLKMTIGDLILIMNVIIFAFAARFLGINEALYSMITYLSASKTLDFIVEGIEEYIGVSIISTYSDEIRLMIIQEMGRGVTLYKGKRGFGKKGESKDIDIVYTVLTRLELHKIHTELEKIDPDAFVVMNSVKDIKGGMLKKRAFLDH